MQALYSKARGFTIVEIIVVIVVLGILANIVFVTLSDYYIGSSTSAAKIVQESDTRSVLRVMEKEISEATGFSPEYPSGSNPVAPLGSHDDTTAWNYMDNGRGPVLIVYKNAATQLPSSDPNNTRVPVFDKPSSGSCAPADLASATPAKNAYIYFVAIDPTGATHPDGTPVLNLYRRIIAPTPSSVCNTNIVKTTCTATKVATNSTYCFGSDALLIRDIATFDVQYFSTANADSPYADAYNSGTPATDRYPVIRNAGAIEITVTSRPLSNQDQTSGCSTSDSKSTCSTATIRISLS